MGETVVGARSGPEGPNGGAEPPSDPVEEARAAVTGTPSGSGEDRAAADEGAAESGGAAETEGTQATSGAADSGGPARKRQRPLWKELPLLVGVALLLALLIKTFLVQAFSIPSDSMQDTLQKGDRVLVDKLTPWFGSEPERGEVVVFRDPGKWLEDEPVSHPNPLQKALGFIGLMPSAEERDLIKRVIGVGGDTVECKGTGPLKVNGKALDEPYVYPGNTPCSPGMEFKVTVPKGRIWVMGDHRQYSEDSRFHQDEPGRGTVPVDNVVGRAIVIAWPIGRWATLPVPDTFDQPGVHALAAAAPDALAVAGAVPLVWWRRRRQAAAG
ncbi:S26 family signal peptidase [Streptomyces albus subsp. albus]|nr:S26 family signal peptidase [Streptomyces albus subsp. albus]